MPQVPRAYRANARRTPAVGAHRAAYIASRLDVWPSAAPRSEVMGYGIMIGLVVLVGGLLFAFGLIGDQKVLIGAGLLVLALCAIFGLQPDWPVRRRSE